MSWKKIIESFRFGDEDEDEDEDEALCFHHNEIFKLFRLQLIKTGTTKLIATTLSRHHCHGFEHAHSEQKWTLVLVLVLVFVLVLESKALY